MEDRIAASPRLHYKAKVIWVHDQTVKERGNAGLMAPSWGGGHKGPPPPLKEDRGANSARPLSTYVSMLTGGAREDAGNASNRVG